MSDIAPWLTKLGLEKYVSAFAEAKIEPIIEPVRKTKAPNGSPLSIRIGIATGVVIVDDLIGSVAVWRIGPDPSIAAYKEDADNGWAADTSSDGKTCPDGV